MTKPFSDNDSNRPGEGEPDTPREEELSHLDEESHLDFADPLEHSGSGVKSTSGDPPKPESPSSTAKFVPEESSSDEKVIPEPAKSLEDLLRSESNRSDSARPSDRELDAFAVTDTPSKQIGETLAGYDGPAFANINQEQPFSDSWNSIDPDSSFEIENQVGTFLPDSGPSGVRMGKGAGPVAQPAGPNSLAMTILITWASLATIVAFWLWLTRTAPHPGLETLPDDGKLRSRIVSPLEPLDDSQIISIGETRQFGDLEVTPVSIVNDYVHLAKDGESQQLLSPFLIMELRLKNLSRSHEFYPLDPVFLYFRPGRINTGVFHGMRAFTYSYLQSTSNPDNIYLPYDLNYEHGEGIVGQSFPLLTPGESKRVRVYSGEGAFAQCDAEMIWRLKLRKGKSAAGQGMATVIGVRFRKSDVKDHSEALTRET